MTFTPNWGKRSGSNQLDIGNSAATGLNNNGNSAIDTMFRFGATRNAANGNNCKPSVDSVMLIYRMIQVCVQSTIFSSISLRFDSKVQIKIQTCLIFLYDSEQAEAEKLDDCNQK